MDKPMKPKTKEEILESHGVYPYDGADVAMEEYAEIEAIAFAEWLKINGWKMYGYMPGGKLQDPIPTNSLYAQFTKETGR